MAHKIFCNDYTQALGHYANTTAKTGLSHSTNTGWAFERNFTQSALLPTKSIWYEKCCYISSKIKDTDDIQNLNMFLIYLQMHTTTICLVYASCLSILESAMATHSPIFYPFKFFPHMEWAQGSN